MTPDDNVRRPSTTIHIRVIVDFCTDNGLGQEASQIQIMRVVWPRTTTTSVKIGSLLILLREQGLLQRFKDECYAIGNIQRGQTRIARYIRIAGEYEDYLASGENDESQAQPDFELVDEGSSFAAESDLRDYLAENLETIEEGLTLYSDSSGTGVEYQIDSGHGRIDILAEDMTGRLVVIELKVSRGRNSTIGQLSYYMGWVDENIPGSDQCRGLIIAREITNDLRIACRCVQHVSLYQYGLSVTTEQVPLY